MRKRDEWNDYWVIKEMNAKEKGHCTQLPSFVTMLETFKDATGLMETSTAVSSPGCQTLTILVPVVPTRFSPTPYPSSNAIIARMDNDDDHWYHDTVPTSIPVTLFFRRGFRQPVASVSGQCAFPAAISS